MKKLTSLLLAIGVFCATAFTASAQAPLQYRVDDVADLLAITLYGSDAKVTAWVGGNTTRDDGLGGMFYYDGNSSAATNVYAVFKPTNNAGRWFKLPTSVAWQNAAVTVGVDSTYGWKFLRGTGQTNFFGIGADDNITYLQTFNGKNLHINNQGNHTILNATAGNVGIGEVTPQVKTHISLSDATTTTAPDVVFIDKATTGTAGTGIGAALVFRAEDDAGTVKTAARIKSYLSDATAVSTAGVLTFSTRGTDDAIFIANAGNVGIGTTTPATLLEARGGLTTTGSILTLGTKEPSVVVNDVLGRINFYAPLDAAGTDANLVAGSIATVAEGTFSATSNASSLIFQTGSSETATTKMTITSAGNATVTGAITATLGDITASNGNLLLGTAGNGLQIKEGSNARMGTATLSGGTVTVSNTSAVTGDRIFIQRVSGTSAEFGHLAYAINTGVGFDITSTDAQDDSVVNWLIIKPTP